MKNKKTSLVLAAIIAVMTMGTAYGYEMDIDSHWAKNSFMRLEEMGIINGYDDGSYRPDEKITRAEFFAIINRISNVSKNNGSSFTDVSSEAWYKSVVDYAAGAHYASGYDDGSFRPNDYITRTEAAAAVVKAFGGDKDGSAEFTDAKDIPEWAKDYVDILSSSGTLSGDESGAFRPNDCITRAETAAMFDKFIGKFYSKAENLNDYTFEDKVLVRNTNIIFDNVTFNGDIYIGSGVSGGEIRFLNCKIGGNVYIAGRDNSAVVFENTDCKKICVNSTDTVTVISTGSSEIDTAVIRSECKLAEMNSEKGIKNITAYSYAELLGDFESAEIADGRGIKLSGGRIRELSVTAKDRPNIEINGTADKISAKTSCIINGKSIQAGTGEFSASKDDSDDIEYSYTIAALTGKGGEFDPSAGGTRTDISDEKECTINSISVIGGTIKPAFSPDITEYTITAPKNPGSAVIIPETDDDLDCKVNGISVKSYTADKFGEENQTVIIDVYSGIAKKNTYTFTFVGYGTDDTTLSQASLDRENSMSVSDDGKVYSFMLKGDIDYSSGHIPVRLSVSAQNSESKVMIDGEETKEYIFDLYDEKKKTVKVTVISEDKTAETSYTVNVERPNIPAIDDPNPEAVERIIANPDAMTEEDIKSAKIYGYDAQKKTKYAGYLKQTAYHADGKDTVGKQAVIQNAVNIVNEYDGKVIRLEAEDNYTASGWNPTVEFAGKDGKCLNMAAKFYAELELPEGSFEMRVCAASAWWQDLTVTVNLNGETVYSEKSGSCFGNPSGGIKSEKFVVKSGTVSFGGGKDILETVSQSNLYLDYIELEMQF